MGLSFTEKQQQGWDILTNPAHTRILFDGGGRSGKTILITEYLIMRAFQFPGSRQLIARKHRAHAEQSIWNETLRFYLNKYIPSGVYLKREKDLTVTFTNGSEIIIDGLDDADRLEKILGREYITIFLNEATQLSWNAVSMVLTRLAQQCRDENGSRAIPKLLIDCNPRGQTHWLYAAGVQHIDPETRKALPDRGAWARLNWSAYDNIQNLPPEYIRTLETLPDVIRDRMLNGIWRNSEGLVYDEFKEDVHVVKPFDIPGDWRRLRAIDFGYTNPFVCLWGALDNDGRLYVYREYYKSHELTTAHAEYINKTSNGENIYLSVADHDAAERAELNSKGIYTSAAKKDVQTGIQAVKNRLGIKGDGKPRLFIFSTLEETLNEIGNYEWEPPKEGRNAKEEPRKEDDHAMDALRYMVMAADNPYGDFIAKEIIKKCAV